MSRDDYIKEALTDTAERLASNKAFIESLPADKVRLLENLQIHLKHCVEHLCEYNDLWISDVRELETHTNALEFLLQTEPCEHQLERFAKYGVSWPPKQRGRPKKAA